MAELKPCPNCGCKLIWEVHVLSARLPWWYFRECSYCYWCGETKLFKWKARQAWNRRAGDGK